jgi:ABC-2 type transport system permease protein
MEAMNVAANWNALFMILTQGMGIGGIMVYGFVTSWIFGREYSDKTVKDLLSLPTSRAKIINAKYIVYLLWSLALALSNLLLGVCIGMLLRLPGFDSSMLLTNIYDYFFTAVLTIIIGTPIAFFAMWGNGYLAPLGFVALLLVFSQIIAAIGYGQFFPWAIPALYSGVSGTYKDQLNGMSYFILVLIAATGYCITSLYWKYADQKK